MGRMGRVVALLVGWSVLGAAGSPASAQQTTGVGESGAAWLGGPVTDSLEAAPTSNVAATLGQASGVDSERPYHHLVRRIDGPPPVGAHLPPPVPRYRASERSAPKPVTFDFVFIGRAGVDGPSTNVKMTELGATYRYRQPLMDRFAITARPIFDVLFLSGPGGAIDLPEQLYKVAVDFQGDYEINEQWGVSVGLTPGFWSDFAHTTSDDIRLPARVLATYRHRPGLIFAGGLLYTDNIRRNLLPGVGVIWDVTDRTRLELMWPRYRVVYKLIEDVQVYGVYERGGDTYNIRTGFDSEDFEYRDRRFMLGTQIDYWSRASIVAELGVSFYRRFRFDIQTDADINSAFFMRLGTRF